jgi:hypothetical protein
MGEYEHQFLRKEVLIMKKAIVSLISLAALGTVLATPLIASAQVIRIGNNGSFISFGDHDDEVYIVLYRRHRHSDWQYYGSFESRHRAERVADRLEDRGFTARIERRER